MIVTFVTKEYGKIEINTDTMLAYFFSGDIERNLHQKTGECNSWYFNDMSGNEFVFVRCVMHRLTDGKLESEKTYSLREIRPITLAFVKEDGKQIFPEIEE